MAILGCAAVRGAEGPTPPITSEYEGGVAGGGAEGSYLDDISVSGFKTNLLFTHKSPTKIHLG